ncbi:MAG: hypothetical protein IJF40_03900 [Clostridia bacterium]|nr:hypothetical protein [Clostridia bacterium]MBQ7046485.1 hypothetical protein [Oscillospiraceae bacterium]
MKKSSFVAMILGTVSGVLFALGMCMTLLAEWRSFTKGIVLGVIGLILAIITVFVWRKMEKKEPLKLNKKTVFIVLFGIIGALLLGLGMCFCMVWENIAVGVLIGIVGIVALLSLIPIVKGIK